MNEKNQESLEYKTLEEQIIALWKSRGLAVLTIVAKPFDKTIMQWTITAKNDSDQPTEIKPPKQLLSIDIFRSEALPRPLQEEAVLQHLTFEPRTLVAVKTFFVPSTPTAFQTEFMPIGRTPNDFAEFMRKLAAEDGIDLNECAKTLQEKDGE